MSCTLCGTLEIKNEGLLSEVIILPDFQVIVHDMVAVFAMYISLNELPGTKALLE